MRLNGFSKNWMNLTNVPEMPFYLSEETKEELKKICAYWHGKTTLEKGRELMTDTLREIHAAGIIRAEGNLTSGDGHIAVNFEKILKLGIQGYLDKVEFNVNNST
jgi:formate C-acetyltransferase